MYFAKPRQKQIELDAVPLAKGGEGTIFCLKGNTSLVAKIYYDSKLKVGNELEAKLQAMLANPPQDQTIVWPTDLLYDGRKFVGYLMPRLQQTIDLLELYNPQQRQTMYQGTDWRYLHIVAKNLAAAFHSLHHVGYVMGDVNQKNVLVEPNGTIRLVDTDSFQIQTGNGRIFRCLVGVSDYTPRELKGKDLSKVNRNAYHDAFGLGILIFQLLMEGSHPFTGRPQNLNHSLGGVMMTDHCIDNGIFPYDPKSQNQYTPPPNAPKFNSLHFEVQKLFIECFVSGHSNPVSRPTATEWHKALTGAINDLKQCARDKTHWYFPSTSNCPWCAKHIARTQPMPPPLTYVPPLSPPIPQPYYPPVASPTRRQAKASGNRAAFWMAILLVILGSLYAVLNTISFETRSSIDTSSIGRLTDPTAISNSVRPTRYIEPTSIPPVTPVMATNANNPAPNLLNLGNGQCPTPDLSSQLSPSQIAVANDVLRLRSEPNTNAEILNRLGTGELVTLIQGPVCSQNWLWWQVQTSNNQFGWVIEIGRGGEIRGGGIYLLLPEGSELGPEVNRAD